jgi:thiazole synthase
MAMLSNLFPLLAVDNPMNTDTKQPQVIEDMPLVIAGKTFKSRFFLGTGKFKNKSDLSESILSSGTELVTVALRRIDLERHEDNILEYIPSHITLMTNTSGARNAKEAIRIAHLARESGCGNWIKIEVINDSKYLLPDNNETIKATATLAAEGFIVLPYMYPDLYAARELVKAGAATVMPLGSLIGSNQGLKTKEFIQILLDEIDVPIIVDAGIGSPSQAAEAMEMGAAAVLANTAVATAGNPATLAQAFSLAVKAGRLAYLSRAPKQKNSASASSPLTGFLYES